MMGEREVAQALFYEFSLERHVPADHWVRALDRFVDVSDIRAHPRPFYSEIGRPSIDPELMIRMLLVGYCCQQRFGDCKAMTGIRQGRLLGMRRTSACGSICPSLVG